MSSVPTLLTWIVETHTSVRFIGAEGGKGSMAEFPKRERKEERAGEAELESSGRLWWRDLCLILCSSRTEEEDR